MSRINDVYDKIITVLNSIDGTNQGTYTYNTTTGTVEVYDECLSLGLNANNKAVNHVIREDDSYGVYRTESQVGQMALTNETVIMIESKLHNLGDEPNARNAIRIYMNDLHDDLVYAFYNNHTLGGVVNSIEFVNHVKAYDDVKNNRIQSGRLISRWKISFNQSLSNPAIPSCA